MTNFKNVFVTITDVNKLVNTPMLSVKAKPLTKLVPKKKRIAPTKIVVKFPSLMDGQALLTPASRADK